MSISKQLEGAIQEAQKVAAGLAFPDEEMSKPGAFKVSSKVLRLWKKETGKGPADLMFTKIRKLVSDIPRNELPKYWGEKDIPDTQDFIAHKPRDAFKKWMRLSVKDPKLAKVLRAMPDNAALIYYMFMERTTGQDLANILFKRYFETESGHPGEFKAGVERKKKEAEHTRKKQGKFQAAGI